MFGYIFHILRLIFVRLFCKNDLQFMVITVKM